jgi:hypothetical protein
VGDICGNFYDASGRACPGPFADRVVGIRLEDLRRAPLVVACAGGAEKVPAIAGALRGRLVSALVTDEHTARGVLELMDGRGRRGAAARQPQATPDPPVGRSRSPHGRGRAEAATSTGATHLDGAERARAGANAGPGRPSG